MICQFFGFQFIEDFKNDLHLLFLHPQIPPPPHQGTNEFEGQGPQRVPTGGRGEGGWILFQKISNDISILGFAIMISICFKGTLRTPNPPKVGDRIPYPKARPQGGREAEYYFTKSKICLGFQYSEELTNDLHWLLGYPQTLSPTFP